MTKVIWRFFLSWFILDRLGRDRTANKSLFGGGGGGAGGPPGEIPNCRHQTGKICENVKYNLQQYKYRGQKDIFKALYEAALVGPEAVKPAEAEDILGLNTNLVTKAISKRSSMGFPMDFDSEDSIPGSVFFRENDFHQKFRENSENYFHEKFREILFSLYGFWWRRFFIHTLFQNFEVVLVEAVEE